MSDNVNDVLLVGPGTMGIEYAKVLQDLNVNVKAVGRGEKNAKRFQESTGIEVQCGDLQKVLKSWETIPEKAIIAASVEQLAEVTLNLLECGVKNILVEKPGAIVFQDIEAMYACAKKNNANVYIAYNRRFYASVLEAKRIIEQDGGVKSFNFEFTEWGFKIEPIVEKKSELIKETWLLQNSTHVIDLAFFLGGKPKEMSCFTEGSLPWHKTGCVYAGAGTTEDGVLFSYGANWDAPGRWAVEILTSQHRLYLKPMEELQIQNKGSVAVEKVDIDDALDKQFKPGLYREVEAFLYGKNIEYMQTIEDQVDSFKIYAKIENKQN